MNARLNNPVRAKGRWSDIVWATAIVLGVILLIGGTRAYVEMTDEAQRQTGSIEVSVTGDTAGQGWLFAERGTLHSTAEHKETHLTIYATRTSSDSGNRAPVGRVTFDNGLTCTVPRAYLWASAEGSTVKFYCDSYLPIDDPNIQRIGTGSLEAGDYWAPSDE